MELMPKRQNRNAVLKKKDVITKMLVTDLKAQFDWVYGALLLRASLLIGISSMTYAEEDIGIGIKIEEIIVTAQKRAESIQDVPISMQAVSGEEIRNMGLTRSDQILNLYPNITASLQSENNINFFIRGVGTSDFHSNNVSAVGVYLDEVSINSPYGTSFSLFDMERVEVMRGPQNTLFGRNTTGGAINFISRKPDPSEGVNGYWQATYGRYEQIDVDGALGIPVSDKIAVRIAGSSNNRDAIFENPLSDENFAERERHAGRFQLRWLVADNVDVLWNAHGGINRGNGRPYKNIGLKDPNDPTQPCPVPASSIQPDPMPNCAMGDGFVPTPSDWNDVFSLEKPRENIDIWGTALNFDWDLPAFTFTSITSFDTTEVKRNDDSDGSPGMIFQFYQESELEQWSQELRLASPSDQDFRWIGGFYYFLEEADYSTAVRRTVEPSAPSTPGSLTIVPATLVQQDNEVFSVYGQGEYDLYDQLKLTLGLRWSNETKEGVNVTSVGNGLLLPDEDFFIGASEIQTSIAGVMNICPPPVGSLFCVNPTEKLDGDWSQWGGRLSLDYQWTKEFMFYGSVSRGFKGGGFSVAALSGITGLAAQSVEPEVLLAYELGGKATLFDNRLQLNGALFYYEWEELQSFQVLEGTPQLLNVPEASLAGVELEVQFVPAEGWYIQAGLGYLDGEIDDVGGITSAAEGNNLVQTPEWTATGQVRKDIPLSDGTLSLQSDFRYKDEVDTLLSNLDIMRVDQQFELNARVAYNFDNQGRYKVILWGRNLTDDEYCSNRIDMTGLSDGVLCVPNEGVTSYGITFSAEFE